MSASNADSLLRSYFIAKLQDFDFHVTYVPQELDISEDVLAFDPEQMKLMYETGRKTAQSSKPWDKQPLSTDEISPYMMEELTKRLEAEF